MRTPSTSDAASIWQLVRQSGVLDENSLYAYLLLTTHFAETCVVAVERGELLGFVTGYVPPIRPDALFVWQVAVAQEARGRGLGKKMLRHLVERVGRPFLEATVTPSNSASQRLFASLASEFGAALKESSGFSSADFGGQGHEEERLIRIGPFGE